MQLLPAWSHMETKMLINNVWQYKYNIKHFSFFTHRNHNIFCITHIGLNLANFNVFCTTLLHFSVLALKEENNMLLAKIKQMIHILHAKVMSNTEWYSVRTIWKINTWILNLFKQWNTILYVSWKFNEFK